jgi:hypothetical protein
MKKKRKLEIGKDPIPFPFKFDVDNLEGLEPAYYVDDELVKIEKEIAQDLYDYWNDGDCDPAGGYGPSSHI